VAAQGPQTFGQACEGPDAGACTANLICARVNAGAPQGFCTQPCSATNACPVTPPNAVCDVTLSTATLCGWPCAGDGGTCPPGLSCLPTGATFFCQ